MERQTLSFPSVFDLHDFKKEMGITPAEARVNLLTGHFTTEQLEKAIKEYKAELLKNHHN